MKRKTLNAALVWKQFEDLAAPRLGLSLMDRAAYSHLLRHSCLEGKHQLRFGIAWLARGIGISHSATRRCVRRLVSMGALRLLERGKPGHLVEVLLPAEIVGLPGAKSLRQRLAGPNIEQTDFLQTWALRNAIHQREGDLCFYCRKKLNERVRGLDHVKPLSRSGRNSYRNLVSCCLECNSEKGERPAEEHLRRLYREHRLTASEFRDRREALSALAAGKLRPTLPAAGAEMLSS